jgi:ribosomal protein S18 acetylase RimI-like enzyme
MPIVRVTNEEHLTAFCTLAGAARLSGETPAMRQADAHWLAVDAQGQAKARCSLWWSDAPSYLHHRVGCIGHFAAAEQGDAAALLAQACAELAAAGCTLAVGPLDGNTFRAYRLVTRRSFDGPARPPFFLEPENPDTWPADFLAAGFAPLAEYYSAVTPLDAPDPRLAALTPRLAEQEITVRALDPATFDADLARLYDLVMASFARALLFAPISREEFVAQYTPLRAVLVPQLVLLAEQTAPGPSGGAAVGGAAPLVGFLLALPDLAQAQRGEPVDTVILKTLAVLPELGGAGLGSALTALVQEKARQMGFRQAIHALMQADNISRKISAHYAQPMRQYTLFAKQLTANGWQLP